MWHALSPQRAGVDKGPCPLVHSPASASQRVLLSQFLRASKPVGESNTARAGEQATELPGAAAKRGGGPFPVRNMVRSHRPAKYAIVVYQTVTFSFRPKARLAKPASGEIFLDRPIPRE